MLESSANPRITALIRKGRFRSSEAFKVLAIPIAIIWMENAYEAFSIFAIS
jgi:hypothetical protein